MRTSLAAANASSPLLRQDAARDLAAGRLTTAYQPLIDLRDGSVRGVEVLARWRHPHLGQIAPDTFLPLLHSAGMMPRLTVSVLERAVADVLGWGADVPRLDVAVNIEPLELMTSPTTREAVMDADTTLRAAGHRLVVELVERTRWTSAGIDCIVDLHAQGIRFALDDFGAGHAGLTPLMHVPVDEVKLDRWVISQMRTRDDERSRTVLAVTVGLIKDLGISVVAEGIEKEADLRVAQALGIDLGQGWLWSPAVAGADAPRMLAA